MTTSTGDSERSPAAPASVTGTPTKAGIPPYAANYDNALTWVL